MSNHSQPLSWPEDPARTITLPSASAFELALTSKACSLSLSDVLDNAANLPHLGTAVTSDSSPAHLGDWLPSNHVGNGDSAGIVDGTAIDESATVPTSNLLIRNSFIGRDCISDVCRRTETHKRLLVISVDVNDCPLTLLSVEHMPTPVLRPGMR